MLRRLSPDRCPATVSVKNRIKAWDTDHTADSADWAGESWQVRIHCVCCCGVSQLTTDQSSIQTSTELQLFFNTAALCSVIGQRAAGHHNPLGSNQSDHWAVYRPGWTTVTTATHIQYREVHLTQLSSSCCVLFWNDPDVMSLTHLLSDIKPIKRIDRVSHDCCVSGQSGRGLRVRRCGVSAVNSQLRSRW